jgi:hypothetical protein
MLSIGVARELSLGGMRQRAVRSLSCVRGHQSRPNGIPHQTSDIVNIEPLHQLCPMGLDPTFRRSSMNLRNFSRGENLLWGGERLEQTYRSHIFDHLGRVAGLVEALGLGDGIDKATPQHPARPIVTAGNAVKAMGLNGLGLVNPRLSLVPQLFQNTPPAPRIAPAMAPAHRHDETLGRA